MAIEHLHAVPHLTTALSGPLQQIEERLLRRQTAIEQWLRRQWLATPAPFYASVDLRNAGFKLAPVDTNLFPAGFNNLNPAFQPLCIQAVQAAVDRFCPKACGILLVPESHTRNIYYLESLAALADILRKAGFEARIGSLLPLEKPEDLTLPSGRTLRLEPLRRAGDELVVEGFSPCFVLLNNDLSGGRPAILENLDQPVVPPLAMGWSNRLKSNHFSHYRDVAREFAEMVEIDPWLIDPYFRKCGKIDFQRREGEDCLASNVDVVLETIREKYRQYGITQEPFAIVKADAGTYGMNIMTVRHADEVSELNRKQRTKMARGKEGLAVTDVLVQEGVYTFETWGDAQAVAEPVVYMIDRFVVGGFYRVHTQRGKDENLNAPGMTFEPLAFADTCTCPDPSKSPDANPNRFYAYGVIARLALLAAARELKQVRDTRGEGQGETP
ncbi:MAG: glutamate--cysteine ligase [Candidatus Muproteobacteria bacterium RBG_16_64_11]|uniref:Glutamate--cysteine ligase n=1 Tax=Candidatus Muproteobacteria bacterium RBG_16_64_11 TaxID=1817758 RepID=A0A1F6TEJ1_9PROT|nr:MAG: glutamate--cysteine ligase [Candidatus Muproteobacteria bacterium RBG_16_64_11]